VGVFEFLRLEAIGGLMLAAAAGNRHDLGEFFGAPLYQSILELPISIRAGELSLSKPLLLWVNDGLMAIFFFARWSRNQARGHRRRIVEPRPGAAARMAAHRRHGGPRADLHRDQLRQPVAMRGWAIPAATDIAFALGLMALLGDRVPPCSQDPAVGRGDH